MFEVATQAAIAPQPAKGALHYPAARQHDKSLGVCGARRTTSSRHPNCLRTYGGNVLIGPIGPDELEATPAIMDVAFDAA